MGRSSTGHVRRADGKRYRRGEGVAEANDVDGQRRQFTRDHRRTGRPAPRPGEGDRRTRWR